MRRDDGVRLATGFWGVFGLWLCVAALCPVRRATPGPLFDSHLHYNEEAWNGQVGPHP
jgi:hypothetical protein